jgi:transcriptional regulator with XRE-family HTH domain
LTTRFGTNRLNQQQRKRSSRKTSRDKQGGTLLLKEYIGQALNRERTAQNRTLRGTSTRAFVSYTYLSEVERGLKDVSSSVLESICTALNITVEELMIDVAVAMQRVILEKELQDANDIAIDSLLKTGG